MNIPKTKDGKYELLFPEATRLRSAVEGRLMWEALARLSSDKGLVEKLDARVYHNGKYHCNAFFSHYDPYKDCEGIFTGVSLPLVARINPDESQFVKGKKRRTVIEEATTINDGIVGDGLQEPYGKILDFDGIWNADSFNVFGATYEEQFNERMKGRFQLDIKETAYAYTLTERVFIRDVLADSRLVECLEKLSMFYVFHALNDAEWRGKFDPALPQMHDIENHYFKASDAKNSPSIRAYASLKLQKQVNETAIALCNEYLAEMK